MYDTTFQNTTPPSQPQISVVKTKPTANAESENDPDDGGFGLLNTLYIYMLAAAIFFGMVAMLMLIKSPAIYIFNITSKTIFEYSDIVSTIVFAVGGANIAVRSLAQQPFCFKRTFIICACAFSTANGGGTFRDVLSGKDPFWMATWIYILLPIVIGIIASKISMRCSIGSKIMLRITDNFSAGIFASSGVIQASNMIDPSAVGFVFLAVFVGTVTAVGGGLIRDLFILQRPPTAVVTTYGIAAFIGSYAQAEIMRYGILQELGFSMLPIWLVGALIVFGINELTDGWRPLSKITSQESKNATS